MTCDNIRQTNTFNETCQVTVPQAIVCFLESTDFESAIRLAVSIGGDSDTIAAITGSIAEAYYGIPEQIKKQALGYLPQEFINVIDNFNKYIGK
jgi:ADP-ribosylglycohydrolase